MSAEFNYHTKENINIEGKVRVTDLISRLNKEKRMQKIELLKKLVQNEFVPVETLD